MKTKPFQRTKKGRRLKKQRRIEAHQDRKGELAGEQLNRWFASGRAQPLTDWIQRRSF